jgi:hypothetical protein
VHHSWIVLRRDTRPALTVAELEAPEPGEPREGYAAKLNVLLLSDQLRGLYQHTANLEYAAELDKEHLRAGEQRIAELERARDRLDRELDEERRRYHSVVQSKSWALTRPLRELGRRARR